MGLGDIFQMLVEFVEEFFSWITPVITFNVPVPSLIQTILNRFLDFIGLGLINIPSHFNLFTTAFAIGAPALLIVSILKLVGDAIPV